MWIWIACIVGAYLIGAIPFGVIIARSRGIDIRQHGSRNIGATNVGRVLGKKYGIICFVLDCLKGAVPVLAAGVLTGTITAAARDISHSDMWLWLGVAIAAVLGHMFPVYVQLQGGKGVATGFGALLAMWPLLTLPAIVALTVWFFVLKATRYMAIASMTGALSLPIATAVQALLRDDRDAAAALNDVLPMIVVTTVLALLVVWRHRSNIGRLVAGTEPKMGTLAKPVSADDDHSTR